MSVLVFLCFLKRRIADKNRADTGVCPYTHAATLNRAQRIELSRSDIEPLRSSIVVRILTVICSNCSPHKISLLPRDGWQACLLFSPPLGRGWE